MDAGWRVGSAIAVLLSIGFSGPCFVRSAAGDLLGQISGEPADLRVFRRKSFSEMSLDVTGLRTTV